MTGAPLQDTHATLTTGHVMSTSGTSAPLQHQVVDRRRLSPSRHGHSPASKRMKRARSFTEAMRIGEESECVSGS